MAPLDCALEMTSARLASGIQLEYETYGVETAPTLLLIAGMASQMIWWEEAFCRQLANAGPFRVLRFDNRDTGLSTHLDDLPVPSAADSWSGTANPPYSIGDMATDAFQLLDVLGIDRAHLAGVSMGGLIAQVMAVDHPDRALSLASIMSAPGDRTENVPTRPEAAAALSRPAPVAKEAAFQRMMENARIVGPYYFDQAVARARIERALERSFYPDGAARHLAAYFAAPSHIERLARLTIPVVVIHGGLDPSIPIENGRHTAEVITGARLVTFEKMGHELPPPTWPEVVEAIVSNARRAVK